MNKYLMMSAAAVLASTGANAGTAIHSFQFGTAGGGSYCDGGTQYASSGSNRAWQHTNNNCASAVSYGQGTSGKLGGFGKGADMSDTLLGQNYGIFSEQINFQLPKKLASGKRWALTIGLNGTTSFLGNSGVLINVVPGQKHITSKAKTSTVSNLKQLIQQHRSSH